MITKEVWVDEDGKLDLDEEQGALIVTADDIEEDDPLKGLEYTNLSEFLSETNFDMDDPEASRERTSIKLAVNRSEFFSSLNKAMKDESFSSIFKASHSWHSPQLNLESVRLAYVYEYPSPGLSLALSCTMSWEDELDEEYSKERVMDITFDVPLHLISAFKRDDFDKWMADVKTARVDHAIREIDVALQLLKSRLALKNEQDLVEFLKYHSYTLANAFPEPLPTPEICTPIVPDEVLEVDEDESFTTEEVPIKRVDTIEIDLSNINRETIEESQTTEETK